MVDIIVKPPEIETPHIDAIHGHTRIELKDVHTGKGERIESDNVVTDGIQYYLKTYDFWHQKSYLAWIQGISNERKVTANNLFTDLFGGILLFDKQIPETAQYMPAGTKMIGNGSYKISNSSTVTELGSYNSTESVETNNSFIQVYDYTTTQANGEINSVCLATANGGFVGYGNSTSKKRLYAPAQFLNNNDYYGFSLPSTPYDIARGVYTIDRNNNDLKDFSDITKNSLFECLNSSANKLQPIVYLPSENCILVGFVQASTQEAFILKKNFPSQTLVDFSSLRPNFYGATIYKKININEISTTDSCAFQFTPDGTKAVIYKRSGSNSSYEWDSGKNVDFIVYDIAKDSYSVHTIQNNTGKRLGWTWSNVSWIVTADGNLTIVTWYDNGSEAYVVDFQSNSIIKKLSTSDVSEYYDKSWGTNNTQAGEIQENLFYTSRGLIDLVNKTAYPINGNWATYGEYYNFSYLNPYKLCIGYHSSPDYYSVNLACNPLRLMTINNLPSTITKTAAQTMKVTYSLTME